MRRLTEEAQQNMPKSVGNSITPVDDALQVAGAGLAAKMSPLDHGKIDRHTLNAMAVQQTTARSHEGGGVDAHGNYIDGVVADALGDWEMGVSF